MLSSECGTVEQVSCEISAVSGTRGTGRSGKQMRWITSRLKLKLATRAKIVKTTMRSKYGHKFTEADEKTDKI